MFNACAGYSTRARPRAEPALRCDHSMASRTCSTLISRLGLAPLRDKGSSSVSQSNSTRIASGTTTRKSGCVRWRARRQLVQRPQGARSGCSHSHACASAIASSN